MRKIFVVALLALVSQLTLNAQVNVKKSDKPSLEGSGNIVTKEISVQPFDQLEINGVFSVVLAQGGSEEVRIEADDNLQSLFEVKNEGSTLRIGMKKDTNFNSKKKMKVYITFRNLKAMHLKTVGDVTSSASLRFTDLRMDNKSVGDVDLKLTAQSVNIQNKSVGSVKLDGKAESAVIRNNSVGSLHAGNFSVQKMDIENSGVGSAEVNAEKELKVKDNMLGKVTNKGAAKADKVKKVVI